MSSERNLVRIRHQGGGIPTCGLRVGFGWWSSSCRWGGLLLLWIRSGCLPLTDWVHARQGEFRTLLFHPVLARNGVHPQATFQHQPLAHLNAVLKFLGQISPSHHLEFTRLIALPKRVEPNLHLGDGGLVVLGVTNRRGVDHLHFQHAVVHGLHRQRGSS